MDQRPFLSLTFLAAITLVPWYGFNYGFTGTQWVAFVACMFFAGLSITAGYHRLWAHKTYNAHPVVEFIFALGGAFALQNSALHWSSDHRIHHGQVDDPVKDPYAATNGFWYSHIGWMLRDYQGDSYDDYSNCRDLQRNKIVMWQHKHYLLLTLTMNFGVPIAFGLWQGDLLNSLLLVGFLRLVLNHHTTFFINSLAHIWGKQTYTDKNTARDNGFLAFLTFGEGYHNFHHIFENDYRNGIRWWQFDPTKWLIKSCQWLGLTNKLRTSPEDKIEKMRLAMTLKRSKDKLIRLPNAEQTIMQLQQEYDLLINKLNDYYQVRKTLLSTKREQVLADVEKSELMKQYQELKAKVIEQRKSWQTLTAKLA